MLPWKLVNILFLIIRKKLKRASEKMFSVFTVIV